MADKERQFYINEINRLQLLVDTLTEALNNQSSVIENQTSTINELTAEIAALKDTIKELVEQKNKDSHNSSKPPSSDGYKKPSPKSQRKKTGRSIGGQKGHPGNHMSIPHEPDAVVDHHPDKCLSCPRLPECIQEKRFGCTESRYVVDVEVKTTVTEHRSLNTCECPMGENLSKGNFPEAVKAHVQYGNSVSVLVGLLSTYGAVSAMRIHTLVGSLLGVKLSTGTVMSMVSKCAKKVGPIMKIIQRLIASGKVGNFDETGARLNGLLNWVHNSSTPLYTYQTINKKRGKIGIDANGVLPNFSGVAMHDCWSPYWKYDGIIHAICNAHLLRELTGIEENEPDHTWAGEFKTLLRSMKKAKEKAIASGKDVLSYYYLHKFDLEYERIMALADEQCPAPPPKQKKKRGRQKKGKERCLIERLQLLKDAVCLFIHDFNVPFDNNQAERDIRNVKTKVKVSGCFRSENGAQNYLDVMSYLSTGRKHNVNVFEALTAAFSGNAEIVLQPGF